MSAWLLGTLVATSVLILLVLLVREPVRRRFGSRVTYGLWLIPLARLFMPTLTTTVERAVRAPSLDPQMGGASLPLTNAAFPEPSLFALIGGWTGIAAAIWLAGAVALFLSRIVVFRRDRRAILSSAVEISRVGSIRIVSSPEVVGPVAFGIFDRVIAVPANFERLYDARERHLALEHELAHHRSGDLIANAFAFVLVCLQWFNPLVWVAHAAFRFDQEAACDARILDKAVAGDRADYARAIAKAASGRALLFASALDRPNSLHRRLQSMLCNPNPDRRFAGRLLVATVIAAALPLTASRAVEYIDVPAPIPTDAPVAKTVPAVTPAAVPIAAAAAVAVQSAHPEQSAARATRAKPNLDGNLSINGDLVTINGRIKRWEDLTPAEKDQVRAAVATARAALADAHLDRERAMADATRAIDEVRMNGDQIRQNVERAQANAALAMRALDAQSPELRRLGLNAEQMKAQLRLSLDAVKQVDAGAMQHALAAIDSQKIGESLARAAEAMRRAQAELDGLDARMREERH